MVKRKQKNENVTIQIKELFMVATNFEHLHNFLR